MWNVQLQAHKVKRSLAHLTTSRKEGCGRTILCVVSSNLFEVNDSFKDTLIPNQSTTYKDLHVECAITSTQCEA
jgi:hypothetical protein